MYNVWEGGGATLHWPTYTGLHTQRLIYSFPSYNAERKIVMERGRVKTADSEEHRKSCIVHLFLIGYSEDLFSIRSDTQDKTQRLLSMFICISASESKSATFSG